MQISAAGSRYCRTASALRPRRGFTLIELLVVISIVAIATAGVALAMRDSSQTRLEREAVRLAALLESGRAQSRTRGVPVVWRSTAQGFRFEGLPAGTLPETWLDSETSVGGSAYLQLGPDPVIPPQSITLRNRQTPGMAMRVATDGLRPFALQTVGEETPRQPGEAHP